MHRATTPHEGKVRDLVTFYITSSSIERTITEQLENATIANYMASKVNNDIVLYGFDITKEKNFYLHNSTLIYILLI